MLLVRRRLVFAFASVVSQEHEAVSLKPHAPKAEVLFDFFDPAACTVNRLREESLRVVGFGGLDLGVGAGVFEGSSG